MEEVLFLARYTKKNSPPVSKTDTMEDMGPLLISIWHLHLIYVF